MRQVLWTKVRALQLYEATKRFEQGEISQEQWDAARNAHRKPLPTQKPFPMEALNYCSFDKEHLTTEHELRKLSLIGPTYGTVDRVESLRVEAEVSAKQYALVDTVLKPYRELCFRILAKLDGLRDSPDSPRGKILDANKIDITGDAKPASLNVNADTGEVEYMGETLALGTTKKEFWVFAELEARWGKKVAVDTLIDHVWGKDGADKRAVFTTVSRLRGHLKATPFDRLKIVGVPGFYRLQNVSASVNDL